MKITLEQFPRVTGILRGFTLEETDRILQVMCKSSIRSVEIAYNTPNASQILRYAIKRYGDQMIFGAGTVTSMDALADAVEAGADFVLSPTVFSQQMLDYCKKNKVISVSGALTPSEIAEQFARGADIVKVFPAVTVGPCYFRQLAGPMGHLPLMAVGGIDIHNARRFLEGGAHYLGIGSGLFRREDVAMGNWEAMYASVNEFQSVLGL